MLESASSLARCWRIWLLLAVLFPGLAKAVQAPAECQQCNGSAVLCDRRYNEVAYAATHNAMSNRQDHWLAPNQNYGITRQLNDGIRCLMLDVHAWLGRPYLAHTSVLFGHKLLVDGLTEVRTFLDGHPCEVITLILENYVSAESLARAFAAAGLGPYLYSHQPGQLYPTLREMVLSGKRLVVFTDREGGAYPWLHQLWDYCVETPWKAKTVEDLQNRPNRGNPHNALLIVNHFLTNPLPSVRLASQINRKPFIMNRVLACAQQMHRVPNFVNVDFYDTSDVLEVVDALNGIPPGERRSVAAQPQQPFTRVSYRRPLP